MSGIEEVGEADVELMGSDIRIRRLVPGTGSIAEVNVIVRCNLKCYYYSLVEEKRLRDKPFEELIDQCYQIGEADGVPGLELGLRHSRVGEKLSIRCAARFGYGGAGRNYVAADVSSLEDFPTGVVPPDTDLEFVVDILDHFPDSVLAPDLQARYDQLTAGVEGDREKWDIMNRLKTMQALNLRKDAGNRWFHAKDFSRAAKAYSRATKVADTYFNKEKNDKVSIADTLEEKAQALAEAEQRTVAKEDLELVGIYVTCLNNLVACKLSQGEFAQAKELCVQVLEMEPRNVKALLRAAKASLALDIFEECDACLKVLQRREDLDASQRKEVVSLQAKYRKAKHDYKEKAKQLQQKIAVGLFGEQKKPKVQDSTAAPKAVSTATSSSITPSGSEESVASAAADQAVEEATAAVNSGYQVGTATATANAAQATTMNPNMIMLLGTSIAVVLISLLVATFFRR